MPLSAPAARRPLHTRKVTCQGFFREDGLWDIEGHITDEKHYPNDGDWRGELQPGEYVHNMWIRLTLDEHMVIRDVEAVTDNSPYRVCPEITPNFKRLIGLRIAGGFHRQARERVGGTQGCTHLVELLGPVATTAYQTMHSDKARELMQEHKARLAAASGKTPSRPRPLTPEERRPPSVIDTCHAWAADGEAVRRWEPLFYKGPDGDAVRAQAEASINARIEKYDAAAGD
ncbi:DUF2889 domain-containing protein [Vineibacter terrae]|uniref:DUF2889 domain-containing protein n=1 Tax=Vineibacter terrae TaxID=2586908 RepID=A0A5C8PR70_9HYPH|nr:DUF2889 domain-containing protein [Vineibacter terrae]TXL77117.1 DUF2889 domain-containing protein [Vineibacter terrae]HEX2890527.1 DUF2889 domain-containing protein [Vineibacter terrae]